MEIRHVGLPEYPGACVDDLEQLSRAPNLEPQVVIGHSYGGKVALEWATRPSAHEYDVGFRYKSSRTEDEAG